MKKSMPLRTRIFAGILTATMTASTLAVTPRIFAEDLFCSDGQVFDEEDLFAEATAPDYSFDGQAECSDAPEEFADGFASSVLPRRCQIGRWIQILPARWSHGPQE